MFSECSKIKNLNLSNFHTTNVCNIDKIFYNCSSLLELNIINFSISVETKARDIFLGCRDLAHVSCFDELILRKFNNKQ